MRLAGNAIPGTLQLVSQYVIQAGRACFLSCLLWSGELPGQQLAADYEVLLDLGMLQRFRAKLYVSEEQSRFDWGIPEEPLGPEKDREVRVQLQVPDSVGRFNFTDFREGFLYTPVFTLEGRIRVLREAITEIDWELTPQRTEIGPYRCRLARGRFRGRHYRVWYAPDIPARSGPWKLHGLPGLVVTAREEDNAVFFRLTALEAVADFPETPLVGFEPMDLEEYREHRQKRAVGLLRRIQTRMPRGTEIRITEQKHLEIFR
ncbi:GLPGLI family protein [Robiginitalea sp. SC105]|uniref:GLPGLI family protein n=1 Tax=Robiginitalea sp. SC105 TaxID=2762332 RepID=UPI00163B3C6D|nr:GLPGLI family protein [Robiginitalea sp. SC105]MBC2839703.1 GLPGLI family protein [Robiginitalea sp. SC105]